MQLRIRTPAGTSLTCTELSESSTVADLKQWLIGKSAFGATTSADSFLLRIKAGFPQKTLTSTDADDSLVTLQSLGIRSGETLIVESVAQTQQKQTSAPQPAAAQPSVNGTLPPRPNNNISPGKSDGFVVRRVIPSDNSCLFNAFAYGLDGSHARKMSTQYAPSLRKVIAEIIAKNPILYDEAILGKNPTEYSHWILQNDAWGGALELAMLSEYFGLQIRAFDIKTERQDVYGENAGYKNQVFLLYDGIHYDVLAMNPLDEAAGEASPEDFDTTMFAVDDTEAVAKATAYVKKLHKQRQFTDTQNFALRCVVCQIGIKGEAEARAHAKQTGHQSFAEY